QEIMDVQSQLLFIGSSAKALKLWWQNERGLTNWSHEASTPEGVPLPSYRYERETKSCPKLSLRRNNSDTRVKRFVKTDWQCGQQAKDKLHIYCSQAHKMTFALI
ncbi:hypothetical protein RFY13_07130, partial [Acinetobacter baumannii]|nr:hypothetical protein [Acinetobacter baumannii]